MLQNDVVTSLTTLHKTDAHKSNAHRSNTLNNNTRPKNLSSTFVQNTALRPARTDFTKVAIPNTAHSGFDRTKLHCHKSIQYTTGTENYLTDLNLAIPAASLRVTSPPDRFAATIVIQVIEVLNGHRPARHLHTWLSQDAYQALVRRAKLGMDICGGPARCQLPKIIRVKTYQPSVHAVESAVIVFDGRKIRACALRLEIRRHRWHVVDLEII